MLKYQINRHTPTYRRLQIMKFFVWKGSRIINIDKNPINQWIQCDCRKIYLDIIDFDDSEKNYISVLTLFNINLDLINIIYLPLSKYPIQI